MKRKCLMISAVLFTMLTLNACGQKGDLIKPPKRTDAAYVN